MNKKNLVLQISNHPIIELLKKNRTISNKTIARLIVEELMEQPEQLTLPFDREEEEKEAAPAYSPPARSPAPPATSAGHLDYENTEPENTPEPEQTEPESSDQPSGEDDKLKKFIEKHNIKPYNPSEFTEDEQKVYNFVQKHGFDLEERPLFVFVGLLITLISAAKQRGIKESFESSPLNTKADGKFSGFKGMVQKSQKEEFVKLLQQHEVKEFLLTYDKSLNTEKFNKFIQEFQTKLFPRTFPTPTPDNRNSKPQPTSEPESQPAEEPTAEPESQPAEEPTAEPSDEETSDPETFDPEAEDLETLITTSKALIDEFYDKEFLQEQGILINDVLKQLAKIVEKEEQEKAAKRSKKPEQDAQDLQEEDQEPFNKKERRNIQIDLKSFLRLIKKAKAVLKKFDDLRKKGSIASSGYKKDFVKILVQLQGNIKTLVEDLTPYTNLNEAVEKSDLQKKWDAIEVGYEKATGFLSNIIQAGTETQENFDMENNVKGAYGALMSITGYFPSVNPFGAKTTSGFDEYESKFSEAVDEVKGTIRDILEVTKGTIGRAATTNVIQGLKTFSGQIQNIFGEEARSTFSDVVIKPNAPAVETGEVSDTETSQDPVSEIDQEFNEQLRRLTPEQIATFLNIENPVFRNTFLRLVANNNQFTQKLSDVIKRIGDIKTQAQIISAMTKKVSIAPELIEDLKSGFVKAAKEMPNMIDLEGSLEPTLERLKSVDLGTYNELKNIASDEQIEDLLAVFKDADEKEKLIKQITDGPEREELKKYLESPEVNQTLSKFLTKIKKAMAPEEENLQEIEIRRRTKGGALKVFLEKLDMYIWNWARLDVGTKKIMELWNEGDWATQEEKNALINAYRIPLFADPKITGNMIKAAVEEIFPKENAGNDDEEEEAEEMEDEDINLSNNNDDEEEEETEEDEEGPFALEPSYEEEEEEEEEETEEEEEEEEEESEDPFLAISDEVEQLRKQIMTQAQEVLNRTPENETFILYDKENNKRYQITAEDETTTKEISNQYKKYLEDEGTKFLVGFVGKDEQWAGELGHHSTLEDALRWLIDLDSAPRSFGPEYHDAGPLAEQIENKLKPLIREMLTKGK